jgi:hypothetical protein
MVLYVLRAKSRRESVFLTMPWMGRESDGTAEMVRGGGSRKGAEPAVTTFNV